MEDEEATGGIKRSQANPALHYTLRKGEHLRSSHRSQRFSSRDSPGAFGMRSRTWEVFWFSQWLKNMSIITKYFHMPLAISIPFEKWCRPFPLCQNPGLAIEFLLSQIQGLEGTSQGV